MRTCPNCQLVHPDEVGQCPECGAPMSRAGAPVMGVNEHLSQMRWQAAENGQLEQRLRRNPDAQIASQPEVVDAAREAAAGIMADFGL